MFDLMSWLEAELDDLYTSDEAQEAILSIISSNVSKDDECSKEWWED